MHHGPVSEHGVKTPVVVLVNATYSEDMNLVVILLLLLLLLGGGGFYFGGPAIGGGGVGLILVIGLVIYFLGGFRTKS